MADGLPGPRLPVVLTRPAGQNDALAQRLRAGGHVVLELPALQLTALPDAAPDPSLFDLVVFVSGNAVRMFLDARLRAGGTVWPTGVPAAVVGPASAAALRAHAGFGAAPRVIQPAADAASFDSESLWDALARSPVSPRRVLLVRGGTPGQGRGREWLAGRLRAAGAEVSVFCAYRREPAPWPAGAADLLRTWAGSGEPAIWLFTSKEGVDAIRAGLDAAGLRTWWRQCRLIATHARIAAHLIAENGTPAGDDLPPMLQISSPQDGEILAAIESTS